MAVLAVGGIGAAFLLNGSEARGRFAHRPAACPLLTDAEVRVYAPNVISTPSNAYYCKWSVPLGTKDADTSGEVTVSTEEAGAEDGQASKILNIRRRQEDRPGATIRPLRIGDEAFMVCRVPPAVRYPDCQAYVRVSNAVFAVKYMSYDSVDPANAAQALAAEAVQGLPRT